MQTSAGVASSLAALQDGEIALYQVQKVTADEHRSLQEGFKTLAQADKAVRKCIYEAGAPGCVDAGIDAIHVFENSKVNGLKNPESKEKITLLAETVIASMTILKGAL